MEAAALQKHATTSSAPRRSKPLGSVPEPFPNNFLTTGTASGTAYEDSPPLPVTATATAVPTHSRNNYGVTTANMASLVSAPNQEQEYSKVGNSVPSAPPAPSHVYPMAYPAVQTVPATWADFPDQPRAFTGVHNFEIGEVGDAGFTHTDYVPLLDRRNHHPDDSITSQHIREPTDRELRKGEINAMHREYEEEQALAASRSKAKELTKMEDRAAAKAIHDAAKSSQMGFQVRDPHAHLYNGTSTSTEKPRERTKSNIVLDKTTGEPLVESDDEGDFKVSGEYEVQEYKMSEYKSDYEYKSMYD